MQLCTLTGLPLCQTVQLLHIGAVVEGGKVHFCTLSRVQSLDSPAVGRARVRNACMGCGLTCMHIDSVGQHGPRANTGLANYNARCRGTARPCGWGGMHIPLLCWQVRALVGTCCPCARRCGIVRVAWGQWHR